MPRCLSRRGQSTGMCAQRRAQATNRRHCSSSATNTACMAMSLLRLLLLPPPLLLLLLPPLPLLLLLLLPPLLLLLLLLLLQVLLLLLQVLLLYHVLLLELELALLLELLLLLLQVVWLWRWLGLSLGSCRTLIIISSYCSPEVLKRSSHLRPVVHDVPPVMRYPICEASVLACHCSPSMCICPHQDHEGMVQHATEQAAQRLNHSLCRGALHLLISC
jgi:hypothetical protein